MLIFQWCTRVIKHLTCSSMCISSSFKCSKLPRNEQIARNPIKVWTNGSLLYWCRITIQLKFSPNTRNEMEKNPNLARILLIIVLSVDLNRFRLNTNKVQLYKLHIFISNMKTHGESIGHIWPLQNVQQATTNHIKIQKNNHNTHRENIKM